MRLIKRYANRKLYDTATKTYVTIEVVGAMVSRGEEIQVLDNDTNEDLTSVVLSQLLLEREREQRFLPSAVLSQLWRAGREVGSLGQTLTNLTRPFVPDKLRQFLEQEIELSFKAWLDLAEGSEDELLRLLENLIERRQQARRLNPVAKPELETNSSQRTPTNPVEAMGMGLVRRLGLRRNLDDFEDWSVQPAQTTHSTSLPLSPAPLTTNVIIKQITEAVAQLESLEPATLLTWKPQLTALQRSFSQVLKRLL